MRESRRNYARKHSLTWGQPKLSVEDRYKKTWLSRIKARAERNGLPFNLTIEDCEIPEMCPALGTPLILNDPNKYQSPSMDRVVPSLGYVKDNVRVISYRANQIKSNATIEEMEKVLAWYKLQ